MPLVLSMMAATLLGAFGMVLVLGTVAETAIAANFRDGMQALHAAEAAVEFAIGGMPADGNWDMVPTPSQFVDGSPAGARRAGPVSIDLTEETLEVNALAQQRSTWATPPVYALHAYGTFANLLSMTGGPDIYLVVWIATLPEENAAGGTSAPVVGLIGRAYGATGGRRSVAVAVTPAFDVEGNRRGVRILWWHELR